MLTGLFYHRDKTEVKAEARIGSGRSGAAAVGRVSTPSVKTMNQRSNHRHRNRPSPDERVRIHKHNTNKHRRGIHRPTMKADPRHRDHYAPSDRTASTASTSSLSLSSSSSSSSTSAPAHSAPVPARSASASASASSSAASGNNMPHLTMQWSSEQDNTASSSSNQQHTHPMLALPRLSPQEAEDRIRTMRLQEDGPDLDGIGPYSTADYFTPLRRRAARYASKGGTRGEAAAKVTAEEYVDEDCRIKMTAWSYQVVDHCHINRETVSIAASYLDRYLLTKSGRHALRDRRQFQLAAMTSLYLSLKLFEDVNVEPKVMCGLSRGGYTEGEFEECELNMLMGLGWHVHPPTAVSFVGHFLCLFPSSSSCSGSSRCNPSPSSPSSCSPCCDSIDDNGDLIVELYDCSKYQAELSVNDPAFIGTSQSTIALASLLNSIEMVVAPAPEDDSFTANFLRRIEDAASIKVRSPEVLRAKERLYKASASSYGDYRPVHASSFSGGSTSKMEDETEAERMKRTESYGEFSPRCASFGM